jgi:hypothetical protein
MSALSPIQQSTKGGWTTLTRPVWQLLSTMLPNVQESLTCLFLQAFKLSVIVVKGSSAPITKKELVQARSANRTCLVGMFETEVGFV